jgi:hypothetical protein
MAAISFTPRGLAAATAYPRPHTQVAQNSIILDSHAVGITVLA